MAGKINVILKEKSKKYLRGLGHDLHPLVMVGDKGLSESVIAELKAALKHHELIKVKVRVGDRKDRDLLIVAITEATGSLLIQRIGNVALIFRRNPQEPKIKFPK